MDEKQQAELKTEMQKHDDAHRIAQATANELTYRLAKGIYILAWAGLLVAAGVVIARRFKLC